MRKYGYVWVTLILFLGSFAGQWLTHEGTVTEFINAVMENWQSEFLQLIWQVAGLSFLLFVGSPQSKDAQEATDAKLDRILTRISALETSLELLTSTLPASSGKSSVR
jgi:hypothetical protein